MTDVTLGRAITVSMHELVMEVVVEDPRSDLMALLMLADERGGLSAREVNEQMLFRPADSPHGTMVVRTLMERGLLDRGSPMYRGEAETMVRHPLSSLGNRALGRRRVLRRRRGVFRVLTTDDPLVPMGVLSMDEVSGTRRGRGPRVDTPRAMVDSIGRSLTLPLNASMEVRVEQAAQMAIEVANPPIVNLEIRDDEHGEVVLVKREGGWSPIDPKRDVLGDALAQLGLALEEDEVGIHAPMAFTSLRDRELMTGVLDGSRFLGFFFDGIGGFDYAEADGLSISPRTEDDAVEWGNWWTARLGSPDMGDDEFASLRREVAERFSRWYDPRMVALMMDDPEDIW